MAGHRGQSGLMMVTVPTASVLRESPNGFVKGMRVRAAHCKALICQGRFSSSSAMLFCWETSW